VLAVSGDETPAAPDSVAGFVTFPWDRKCAKGQSGEQRSVWGQGFGFLTNRMFRV
jgi:hypothetical protein